MSAVALSDQLRRAADPVWQAQRKHPFLRGIADGTLPLERFSFYVRQDYLFLIEYARLLALGAARAPDLATMTRFSELTAEILTTEMGPAGTARCASPALPLRRGRPVRNCWHACDPE